MIKRLLPTAAKDVGKNLLDVMLAPLGWKIAPQRSVVLDGHWYHSPVDGVVSRHRPPSLDDERFQQAVRHLSKRNAFSDLDAAVRGEVVLQRLYIAGQLAKTAHGVAGDFVEFGTYRGATAYCMLSATRDLPHAKSITLYDTFAGIPTEGMTAHERDVGLTNAYSETSADMVQENLSEFGARVHFRPGMIPETLDSTGPQQIAMMHVDLNLAQPTLDALRWALPRWSPGGICLLDDYLWEGYEDQRQCVDAFFRDQQLTIIAIPTGQGLVLNQQISPT